jgi:hypothetical protein
MQADGNTDLPATRQKITLIGQDLQPTPSEAKSIYR